MKKEPQQHNTKTHKSITPDLQSLIEEEDVKKVRVVIHYEPNTRQGIFNYLTDISGAPYTPLTSQRVCATLTTKQISQLGTWTGIKEIKPDWNGLYEKR